jgi:hypothetical protein
MEAIWLIYCIIFPPVHPGEARRKGREGVKRVITLLSVVSLVFGVMGAAKAKTMPFDEFPVQSAYLPSLTGSTTFSTGSTADFHAYGSDSIPISGFGVLPYEGNGNASTLWGFPADSFFESGFHLDFAENASPLSSSHASASDNIEYGRISPFSKPSMMLLVGCGLVGLAGIGRKMFQGRRIFRK